MGIVEAANELYVAGAVDSSWVANHRYPAGGRRRGDIGLTEFRHKTELGQTELLGSDHPPTPGEELLRPGVSVDGIAGQLGEDPRLSTAPWQPRATTPAEVAAMVGHKV